MRDAMHVIMLLVSFQKCATACQCVCYFQCVHSVQYHVHAYVYRKLVELSLSGGLY